MLHCVNVQKQTWAGACVNTNHDASALDKRTAILKERDAAAPSRPPIGTDDRREALESSSSSSGSDALVLREEAPESLAVTLALEVDKLSCSCLILALARSSSD